MTRNPASLTPEQRDAARYRPAGSRKVTLKDSDAVVFVKEYETGRFAGWAYAGKAIKPAWRYSFKTPDALAAHIKRWQQGLAASAEFKAKRRADRAKFEHTLQVGDILRGMWGYDQTNVDFFEVVRRSASSVWVRPIKQQIAEDGPAAFTGSCAPIPGAFCGKVTRHTVQPGNYINSPVHGIASKIDPIKVGGVTSYPVSNWTAYA